MGAATPHRRLARRTAAVAALLAGAGVTVAVLLVVLSGLRAPDDAAAADALRPAAPARAHARAVTIGWAGDTVLGSRYGIPPDGGRGLLTGVLGELRRPDVMALNYEGTFGTGGAPKCPPEPTGSCFAFQAPPEHAPTLRWAGVDVVNLANNHAYDHGAEGQRQTLEALSAAGVPATGLPGHVEVVRTGGVRVAFVGFAPYPWAPPLGDVAAVRALVAQAAAQAEVVVALMHAGAEGADQVHTPIGVEHAYGEDRGDTRAFAHAAIDAGADLVLGSGPHVVRGLEWYRDRLVAYSVGNFASYNTFPAAGTLGLAGLLEARLGADGRVLGARWRSLRLVDPGIPQLDPAGASAALVGELSATDFGEAGARLRPDGTLERP